MVCHLDVFILCSTDIFMPDPGEPESLEILERLGCSVEKPLRGQPLVNIVCLAQENFNVSGSPRLHDAAGSGG
jgi:hypothetical protein